MQTLILALSILGFADARAEGTYVKLDYPASRASNELQVAVTYTLWIPEGVKKPFEALSDRCPGFIATIVRREWPGGALQGPPQGLLESRGVTSAQTLPTAG